MEFFRVFGASDHQGISSYLVFVHVPLMPHKGN